MEKNWAHPDLIKKMRACQTNGAEAMKEKQLQKAHKLYLEGVSIAEAVRATPPVFDPSAFNSRVYCGC